MKPVSGTNEWSTTTVNIQAGCENGCLYCYAAAQAIRFGRFNFLSDWREDAAVDQGKVAKRYGKRKGTVMFPSTHDITVNNIEAALEVLVKLLNAGNRVLVVSKPDPQVIRVLCKKMDKHSLEHRANVLFRFTIGSSNTRTLAFWEPQAPSYEERLYALMWAFRHGWQTSVSMEPLLHIDWFAVHRQVDAMAPYVTDAIWIGKANHLGARVATNLGKKRPAWSHELTARVHELERAQGDKRIEELYLGLKGHPKVRWKESIKKVVGLELATEKGQDR
jgi:DNA repair photolyase